MNNHGFQSHKHCPRIDTGATRSLSARLPTIHLHFFVVKTISEKIFRFCRSKCHKNFKMKRNPRKVKWTKAYRKLHGKELTKDTTFEFERRRNRPERYDRNVVQNTLKAIKKIEEVRISREAKLWENRMKGNKAKQIKEDARELEQGIHLVKAPLAMQEEPGLTLPTKAEKMKVEVSISNQQKEHSMEG